MSIFDRIAPDVQWYDLDESMPLDLLIAPADDGPVTFPGDLDAETIAELLNGTDGPEHLPRYRVEPIESKAMGRVLYWVVDASTGRKVSWHAVERNALDLASDLNAEDWPECPDWTRTAPPCEHFDRPVRLASTASQARPSRTSAATRTSDGPLTRPVGKVSAGHRTRSTGA